MIAIAIRPPVGTSQRSALREAPGGMVRLASGGDAHGRQAWQGYVGERQMGESLGQSGGSGALELFLGRCRQSAARAEVVYLPGEEGIEARYCPRRNPRCRGLLGGHAPYLDYLVALSVRARCRFRVPVEAMPMGARIVWQGGDLEVLLAGQEAGQGELIGAGVLLDNDELLAGLLLPEGLRAFVTDYLLVRRGWSRLRLRFGFDGLGFEFRHGQEGLGLWCTFTAQMDAEER